MPKTDPRKPEAKTAQTPKPQPPPLSTAQTVQSEVVAVTQQLAKDVSADAYAIGQQTAEYGGFCTTPQKGIVHSETVKTHFSLPAFC